MKLKDHLPLALLLAGTNAAVWIPGAGATIVIGWDFESNPLPGPGTTLPEWFIDGELPPTPPAGSLYDFVNASFSAEWSTEPGEIPAPLGNEPTPHVLGFWGEIDETGNHPGIGFKVDVSSLALAPGEFLRLSFVSSTQYYRPSARGLDVEWAVEWSEDGGTYSSLGTANTDGDWQAFTFDIPSHTSSALYFKWQPVSVSVGSATGYAGWDDITLTVVPEPKVYLGATGLALAGFALWRRRAGR